MFFFELLKNEDCNSFTLSKISIYELIRTTYARFILHWKMFKFRNFFFKITATPGDFNATHQPVSHGTKFKQQPHLSNLFSSTRHQSTTPSDFFHWPRRELAIFAYKRSTRTGSLNQTMTMESTLNSTKIWYFVRIFRAKIFQVKSFRNLVL